MENGHEVRLVVGQRLQVAEGNEHHEGATFTTGMGFLGCPQKAWLCVVPSIHGGLRHKLLSHIETAIMQNGHPLGSCIQDTMRRKRDTVGCPWQLRSRVQQLCHFMKQISAKRLANIFRFVADSRQQKVLTMRPCLSMRQLP